MELVRKKTILLLEDSRIQAEYFIHELEALDYRQYEIMQIDSLEHAIHIIEQRDNVLLITDVRLDSDSTVNTIDILTNLQSKNKKLRIALYTTFLYSLSDQSVKKLTENNIFLYDKADGGKRLVANLVKDYNLLSNYFKYTNEFILNVAENFSALHLDEPKLIKDIRVINRTFLEIIKRNPNEIYNLSPREFEEFSMELFQKLGHQVKLTQQTRDGGKDLLILKNSALGDFLIYAECKKNAPDKPVGVSVIRELYGTVTSDRATAGIVVTSSYFSDDAKEFTQKNRHQMSIVDFERLKELIEPLI